MVALSHFLFLPKILLAISVFLMNLLNCSEIQFESALISQQISDYVVWILRNAAKWRQISGCE